MYPCNSHSLKIVYVQVITVKGSSCKEFHVFLWLFRITFHIITSLLPSCTVFLSWLLHFESRNMWNWVSCNAMGLHQLERGKTQGWRENPSCSLVYAWLANMAACISQICQARFSFCVNRWFSSRYNVPGVGWFLRWTGLIESRQHLKTIHIHQGMPMAWPPWPLKDNASSTGLVLFWENLLQNFYSIAPNGIFWMSNWAP